MFKTSTICRLTATWLILIALSIIIAYCVTSSVEWLPTATSKTGKFLLKKYNEISHISFLTLLALSCGLLLRQALNASQQNNPHNPPALSRAHQLIRGIKEHPVTTALFAFYTVIMIRQASWFYKEIISWYKDIFNYHLLDNFSLRWSFVKETMFRNDFRFFPLSHQDLHILSWLTPYVSIWMLVNAAELFTIVILGAKIAERLSGKAKRKETLLVFSLLFLFDTATGYTFFQFIYSERIVVLLLALFGFYYTKSHHTNQVKDQYLALLFALLGLFFKDTAFILFTIPACTTILAGSMGFLPDKPRWSQTDLQTWIKCYEFEFYLCSLIGVLAVSFIYLSYLPSLYAGVDAYDSHLRFSRFEPDIRFIMLVLTCITRTILIVRRKISFSPLDALNAGAITYGLGLYAMVGFRSSNYMALPAQFIATINLVVLIIWLSSWLQTKGWQSSVLSVAAVSASSGLIGMEYLGRDDFFHRISKMQSNQDSWVKTYDQIDKISKIARQEGDEVNIIYSKSWFRNRGHLERLKYDRLVYYDLDAGTYTIMDGINKGAPYVPKKGDILLNIDTGKRLKEFGFDMSPYKQIWTYGDHKTNGKIYRKLQ